VRTETWVKRLNKIAREIHEQERSMHPSAWREATASDVDRYIELARREPPHV